METLARAIGVSALATFILFALTVIENEFGENAALLFSLAIFLAVFTGLIVNAKDKMS